MTVALVVLVAVLAVTFATLAVVLFDSFSPDRVIRDRRMCRVVVELQSGETFQGLLASVDVRTLLLRNVTALSNVQAEPMVVDGELLLPRGDVKFVQRP